MKYSIHIDQVHAIEWDLNLSEAACFSFCYTLPSWAETVIIDGEVYYFASRTKVIKELPILTDKSDTVYRLYKSIDEKGLIKYRRFSGKDCIQITAKGKEWNSEKNPSKETDSENFPNELGKKSETDSENFPTYNNTIKDKNTIDKESALPSKIESFNYTSETKPFDAEPTIEKSEKRYLEASQKIKNYFAQFPDDMIIICDLAKKKLSPARFVEELDKWLSRNVENLTLIQNPVARLKFGESSFKSWIEKSWVSENQEQKSNGYANRNTDNSERYTTGEKSPFNAGIGVVDPKYGF